LKLDILKISEGLGVVNKVGGESARQAGLNGKLKSVVAVSIVFYGFEPPSANQQNWGLNLQVVTENGERFRTS
jgi:hypothetical protein